MDGCKVPSSQLMREAEVILGLGDLGSLGGALLYSSCEEGNVERVTLLLDRGVDVMF